jgi:hypothetical protein
MLTKKADYFACGLASCTIFRQPATEYITISVENLLRHVTTKGHIRIIQPMLSTYYTVLLSRWLLRALPALTRPVLKVTPSSGIIQGRAYKTRQRTCVATSQAIRLHQKRWIASRHPITSFHFTVRYYSLVKYSPFHFPLTRYESI